MSNVECTKIIVGRADRLQLPHDKRRNKHRNRHGEVFLKKNFNKRILSWNFNKILRRYQWWSLLFLNLKTIHTRSNWLCWKTQEKFHVEFRFCKAAVCNYTTLLTTYPANKNTWKDSNRNSRKMCQLISKMTLRTPERRHLTPYYLAI